MNLADMGRSWYSVKHMKNKITLIREARIKPYFGCNMWHVRGSQTDMLIDSGFGMVPLRKNVPLLNARPIIAVATHAHCDHIGAMHEFEHRWVHKLEAHIMIRPPKSDTLAEEWYINQTMFFEAQPKEINLKRYTIEPAPPTRILNDGDMIDLGDRKFKILHIPGHSPGSIALWEEDTGILFTGDTVYNGSIGGFVTKQTDPIKFKKSIEILEKLPVNLIHSGHYDSFGHDRFIEIIEEYKNRKNS